MIQCQVLNYIIANKDTSFIIINNLNEEFFSDYKQEFEYIKDHINNYGTSPDIETFLTKFPDFDVITVNETPKYLLDALYEDRNKRFLAKSFNGIRDLLNQGRVEEAMQLYTNNSSIAIQAKHLESIDLLTDISRYEDYLNKCDNFDTFFFKELTDCFGVIH